MKKLVFPVLAVIFISLIAVTGCNKDDGNPTDSAKYKEFNAAMRVLWSDHAQWTRNVIINIVDGAPGTNEAVTRLLKNQEDIGNAIKPYYGNSAGDALTVLLKEHITIAADLITAAKNGNTAGYNAAHADWYANGEEIAVFLNGANPEHWGLADWKAMMKNHLDYTLAEVVARLNADYAADVAAYDKAYADLMMMADMLSEGIAKQFPDKF
jgi:hypothetical protein